MSESRVLLGGVLAGLAIFMWGMISHLALGLGQIGVKDLPNEPLGSAAAGTVLAFCFRKY